MYKRKVASEITARPTYPSTTSGLKEAVVVSEAFYCVPESYLTWRDEAPGVFYVLDNLSENHCFSKLFSFELLRGFHLNCARGGWVQDFGQKNAQTRLKGGENLTGLKRIVVWEMGL